MINESKQNLFKIQSEIFLNDIQDQPIEIEEQKLRIHSRPQTSNNKKQQLLQKDNKSNCKSQNKIQYQRNALNKFKSNQTSRNQFNKLITGQNPYTSFNTQSNYQRFSRPNTQLFLKTSSENFSQKMKLNNDSNFKIETLEPNSFSNYLNSNQNKNINFCRTESRANNRKIQKQELTEYQTRPSTVQETYSILPSRFQLKSLSQLYSNQNKNIDNHFRKIKQDEKLNKLEKSNLYELQSKLSTLNKNEFLTVNESKLNEYRRKGIHYQKASGYEDLIYKFSAFNSKQTFPYFSDKGSEYKKILKKIPLIGQGASDKGIMIYLRGQDFNVKHLDQFISSDTNKLLSPQLSKYYQQPEFSNQYQLATQNNLNYAITGKEKDKNEICKKIIKYNPLMLNFEIVGGKKPKSFMVERAQMIDGVRI